MIAPVTRGSQSWLFGGRVQPSEFAKLALVLVLARYFQRNPPGETTRLRDLVWPGAIIGLPVGLIVLQRDMGVALLTLLIGATYLLARAHPLARLGGRSRWLALAALAALWTFALAPYQKERILAVVDPGRDPLASGYQVNQSRIAIGSGGLLRHRLHAGDADPAALPADAAHRLRVLGASRRSGASSAAASCSALYATLLFWGLVVARSSKDEFGALLAIGVVGCLFWPAVLNVAMVLGLAPVIGVPLPLFSYGGSALVTTLAAIGLLMNVSMRRYVF